MKKVRFTEEQMVMILREADKSPVAEVAKKHKISEQTIYVWRRRFGKLDPADVKRLRELETENAKLKRMVAEGNGDRDPEGDQSPKMCSQARRDQVALAMERGHSQRQACELIALPRSILKYRALRIERDAPVLAAMRRIAATYPRYGYRRVRIFLRREGHAMSPERAYRLWRACWSAIAAAPAPATNSERHHGRVLCRRSSRTKYGPTTSFTMPAPTGRRSNA